MRQWEWAVNINSSLPSSVLLVAGWWSLHRALHTLESHVHPGSLSDSECAPEGGVREPQQLPGPHQGCLAALAQVKKKLHFNCFFVQISPLFSYQTLGKKSIFFYLQALENREFYELYTTPPGSEMCKTKTSRHQKEKVFGPCMNLWARTKLWRSQDCIVLKFTLIKFTLIRYYWMRGVTCLPLRLCFAPKEQM